MKKPRSSICLVVALVTTLLQSTFVLGAPASGKPNVVVMMVDNLGWGELGVYGGGERS